jgi:benzoate membrane transport protein
MVTEPHSTPSAPPPEAPEASSRPRGFWRDLGIAHIGNGLAGFLFAASGPLAIVLATGRKGGLTEVELASWVFGSLAINGLVSIGFSLVWRQPLVFFWTIPGTVLVASALDHLTFPQVIGAYIATGILMLLLGLSGWVKRTMAAIPMPIVMGMVAGAFLDFGPLVIYQWGTFSPALGEASWLAAPLIQVPAFSLAAMAELVVPLAITVLVVQNGQGIAILTAAGHTPPVDQIATGCGVSSIVSAFVGAVPTCLTGPVNAIISATGDRHGQYTAGVVIGLLGVGFGLLAPLVTRLMLSTPPTFIATLAGLAMLRVLQSAFTVAFQGRFALGALVTFLVTVAAIPILGIGAPFWALVAGTAASLFLDRADWRADRGQTLRV